MSIQMTSGKTGVSDMDGVNRGRGYEPVCLYDTVDGMAFGPTFADRDEAEAFLRWFEARWERSTFWRGPVTLSSNTVDKAVADEWRAFSAPEGHTPDTCPFDGDSPGFLGDRDASDGSGAWTPTCQCECHS